MSKATQFLNQTRFSLTHLIGTYIVGIITPFVLLIVAAVYSASFSDTAVQSESPTPQASVTSPDAEVTATEPSPSPINESSETKPLEEQPVNTNEPYSIEKRGQFRWCYTLGCPNSKATGQIYQQAWGYDNAQKDEHYQDISLSLDQVMGTGAKVNISYNFSFKEGKYKLVKVIYEYYNPLGRIIDQRSISGDEISHIQANINERGGTIRNTVDGSYYQITSPTVPLTPIAAGY